MSQTDPIARYRAAAAKVREMEEAGTPGLWLDDESDIDVAIYENDKVGTTIAHQELRWHRLTPQHVSNFKLIRASRNMLLPLLDAGDALAQTVECDEASMKTYGLSASDYSEQHDRNLAALAALTDALERECGGAV